MMKSWETASLHRAQAIHSDSDEMVRSGSVTITGSRDVDRETARHLFEQHLSSLLHQGRTWLVGSAPPSLVAKALRAYGIGRLDGELASSPGLSLCRGAVCLGFDPPAVRSPQSAIIAAPAEIATDGVQIHVRKL